MIKSICQHVSISLCVLVMAHQGILALYYLKLSRTNFKQIAQLLICGFTVKNQKRTRTLGGSSAKLT